MPVISVVTGPTPEDVKERLIERLTAEAAEVTQVRPEHFTVLITELPRENMGVGGKTVKALLSGK